MSEKQFLLVDEQASKKLGQALGPLLKSGDIIALYGDLGSGKTTLTRSIIRFLMKDENLTIPSPSFALVQPYEIGQQLILHVDLYRIKRPNEVEELGLFDDENAIIFIEWPKNDPKLEAKANWQIFLDLNPDKTGRIAKILNKNKEIDLEKLEII